MTNIKYNRGGVNENLSPSEFKREPNTQYVLSISYGKDSLACLGAIEKLGLPLDRIIHAEVWATDDIPADIPPMVEFKKEADKIIKQRYGIKVEHYYAQKKNGEKQTYENIFYTYINSKKYGRRIKGFPGLRFPWCNFSLKIKAIKNAENNTSEGFSKNSSSQSTKLNTVSYVGIAIDEPERLENLDGINKVSPLALIGWTEEDAKNWCEENNLLSPIYTEEIARGGCWFCHNQSINQLRFLRKNYPELWALLLKWDKDSPFPFKADGHTVHDFDKRFEAEEKGLVPLDRKFRWKMLNEIN